MLVASAATVTMALQILFGYIGIGVTILLFVVQGNPGATGAYQLPLLPAFWRTIAYWLPNGAGTDTVRRIGYFGGNGITGHLDSTRDRLRTLQAAALAVARPSFT